jgi:helicase SWR1
MTLEDLRGMCVRDAQLDLEGVHTEHDTHLRELFHLEKFVTYIGFDPEVSAWRSAWLRWCRQALTRYSSQEAARDRSAVWQQFQALHDLALKEPSGSTSRAGRTTRRIVSSRLETLALRKPTPTRAKGSDQDESSARKSKGKGRQTDEGASSSNGWPDTAADDASEPRSRQRAPRRSAPGDSSSESEPEDSHANSDTPSRGGKRSGPSASTLWRQKRAAELAARGTPRRGPGRPRKAAPGRHVYLNPAQLPARPHFAGDLQSYWDSFNTAGGSAEGWEEVPHERRAAAEEAAIATWVLADRLRGEGVMSSFGSSGSALRPAREPARPEDAYSVVVAAAAARASKMRAETRTHIAAARKISRAVQTYWEERLGTGQRQLRAEERRLRALAKWTIREVLGQWKLAQAVVRARKEQEEKESADKAKRAQLKSIIEESALRLGKQQDALEQALSEEDEDGSPSEEEDSSSADESSDEQQLDTASEGELEPETATLVRRVSSGTHSDDESIVSGPSRSQSHRSSREPEDADLSQSSAVSNGHVHEDAPVSAPQTNGHHASPEAPEPIAADEPPVVTKRSRSPSPVRKPKRARVEAPQQPDPDADDVEFSKPQDADAAEAEDAELERTMWDEDEEDDSEEDGLAADADLPIEELMRRYGYGAAEEKEEVTPDFEPPNSGTSDASDADDSSPHPLIVELDEDGQPMASSHATSPDETPREPSEDQAQAEGQEVEKRSRSATRASSAVSVAEQDAVPEIKIRPPFLLRANLRAYQQIGFEWLAGLYANDVNGILADEMGLGKTIQTITLLAHLACDKGIWGPHLVVAPTSVMLNWEVEFKKFLPSFKILSYYGSQKERKEKRRGWNTEGSFNVCITSYQLVLADQHIFRRKPWVYLVLDEAHHIKNFRSQRWQTLLGFNTQRRLLLTGTPLQNNLMDLWSLMHFLMPNGMAGEGEGAGFASMKDFQAWFSNPLDRAVESGERMDAETRDMVSKLHTLLRPYLLRRLKKDVEKELPSKVEHVVYCRLSKRQRFLYNDFMSRTKTRESLASGNYLSVINVLMQLRKVCNHPDLFEVRPIVTSFATSRSVVADFEVKDLLVRRELLAHSDRERVDLSVLNLDVSGRERSLSSILTRDIEELDASPMLPHVDEPTPAREPLDTWTIDGLNRGLEQHRHVERVEKWKHIAYVNALRCSRHAVYGSGLIDLAEQLGNQKRLLPAECTEHDRRAYLTRCDAVGGMVQSLEARRTVMQDYIDRFAFVTPRAVAVDMPRWALPGVSRESLPPAVMEPGFDTLHAPAVKLHIAFPDASLLQYDCGKLQQLDVLMRQFKATGQRVLIFTQMTKVLDILESFLNWRGYRYFRLDGTTKVEQRQVLTERFNRDPRITAFILSTRSGGLGLNLTGASNVVFFDLDWSNASMSQAIDRAHRIGQQREVHIYSLVSEHTIEENMLRRVRQKRQLDDLVVQEGDFTTDHLARVQWRDLLDEGGTTLAGVRVGAAEDEEASGTASGPRDVESALLAVEDEDDANAARVVQEETSLTADFAEEEPQPAREPSAPAEPAPPAADASEVLEEAEEEGGSVDDYILKLVGAGFAALGLHADTCPHQNGGRRVGDALQMGPLCVAGPSAQATTNATVTHESTE